MYLLKKKKKHFSSLINILHNKRSLRSLVTLCANYPRQLPPPFRALSRQSRIYRRGSPRRRVGISGRSNLETLSFHLSKNNVLQSLGREKKERERSFALARMPIYLPLYVARESGGNFFSTISFALRQFRASAAREKRIPRERRNARWCILANDVFLQHRDVAILCFSLSLSLFRPPFYFSVLLRLLEFARPYLRHVPPVQLRPPPIPTLSSSPFPFYYFSSFFQPLPPEYSSSPFCSLVAGLQSLSLSLDLLALLQPRKSKLDAKTRPNVHNARRPTYRVSGTIAAGHRFPPPGRDKCEDGEYRRFVPSWLPSRQYVCMYVYSRSFFKITRLI